jgi:hypothetical protein
MVCPCANPLEWEFDVAKAWFARPIFFFTWLLKGGQGCPRIEIKMAYVSWYHRYLKDVQRVPSNLDPTRGKSLLVEGFDGGKIQLYEPHPLPNYAVICVDSIVGQAILAPNFEYDTIPSFMAPYKKVAFPDGEADGLRGKKGSKLWYVDALSMRGGRSLTAGQVQFTAACQPR